MKKVALLVAAIFTISLVQTLAQTMTNHSSFVAHAKKKSKAERKAARAAKKATRKANRAEKRATRADKKKTKLQTKWDKRDQKRANRRSKKDSRRAKRREKKVTKWTKRGKTKKLEKRQARWAKRDEKRVDRRNEKDTKRATKRERKLALIGLTKKEKRELRKEWKEEKKLGKQMKFASEPSQLYAANAVSPNPECQELYNDLVAEAKEERNEYIEECFEYNHMDGEGLEECINPTLGDYDYALVEAEAEMLYCNTEIEYDAKALACDQYNEVPDDGDDYDDYPDGDGSDGDSDDDGDFWFDLFSKNVVASVKPKTVRKNLFSIDPDTGEVDEFPVDYPEGDYNDEFEDPTDFEDGTGEFEDNWGEGEGDWEDDDWDDEDSEEYEVCMDAADDWYESRESEIDEAADVKGSAIDSKQEVPLPVVQAKKACRDYMRSECPTNAPKDERCTKEDKRDARLEYQACVLDIFDPGNEESYAAGFCAAAGSCAEGEVMTFEGGCVPVQNCSLDQFWNVQAQACEQLVNVDGTKVKIRKHRKKLRRLKADIPVFSDSNTCFAKLSFDFAIKSAKMTKKEDLVDCKGGGSKCQKEARQFYRESLKEAREACMAAINDRKICRSRK